MHAQDAVDQMFKVCQPFSGSTARAEGHVPDGTTPKAAAALMHYRLSRQAYSNGRIWAWVVANPDADLLQARRALPQENGGIKNPGQSDNDQIKQEYRYCHRALKLIGALPRN